ncbi:MAG: hypothetical protein KDE19_22060 [Caldilineaceae bacterium]|nr:hypothetical protein [Caldilineaceae bacterium]
MKPKSIQTKPITTSNSTAKPVLTFVDADIVSGKDEIAREQLLSNLQRYQSDAVSPLWVNWLRHRADLRFVCLTTDLAEYNDFMLDVVRSVQYVRETRTMLSFGGRADIDVLLDLEMEIGTNSHNIAASVLIDVQPGMDRQCFQGLLDLPRHPDVRRVWLLNCYHSEDADLMMMLLGKNISALTGYVMSWVRTVPGVIDTEMDTVLDWRWMAGPDDIVTLCEMFFSQTMQG